MAADALISSDQERRLEFVESQLRLGEQWILIGDRWVAREPAWAATRAIRECWERGLVYGGQRLNSDGVWIAQGEAPDGLTVYVPLGRFEG